MNRTKKRAAKRSQARQASTKREFRWPYPLKTEFKMRNIRAFRDYAKCTLAEARRAVEDPMAPYLS